MTGSRVRVAVVGGGLAGLFTASELVERGVDDIQVLEREDRAGGLVRTLRGEGYSLEPTAGSLQLPHPHLDPILGRAGVEMTPARPEAAVRYIHTGGRLVAVPSSPRAVLAPVVPLRAKLRGALEPLVRTPPPSGEETLASFFGRRFGDRLGGMLAWVAASGVFAGDPTRLSARASFPALTALEDQAGSIVRGGLRSFRRRARETPRPRLHLPVGGMDRLADSLADSLGDRFRPGFDTVSVHHDSTAWRISGSDELTADQVVLAVSPHQAARIVDDELATLFTDAVTAPVVVVGLGGSAGSVAVPPGFGVVTGPRFRGVTRGILFESSYAPERAPEGNGLLKVIAGGAGRTDITGWDDRRILDTVIAEAGQIVGAEVAPSLTRVVRHLPGIPQYQVGHIRWLSSVERALARRPGLHLTGWGYRGVGVSRLATDAGAVASKVASGR